MAHREDIKTMLRAIKGLEGLKIVDWGCGTKHISQYVKVGEYLGIDKLPHVGAGMVKDITEPINLANKDFDVAFCMEVMEHVRDPAKLLENIYNNLKMGGSLYMSVPFLFPIHSNEDYWRYTNQVLKLLRETAGFEVEQIIPTENNAGWLAKATKRRRV